jgi:hypothetical protein
MVKMSARGCLLLTDAQMHGKPTKSGNNSNVLFMPFADVQWANVEHYEKCTEQKALNSCILT